MYRKFRDDPSSVDPSWHEFLVDYSPEPTGEAATGCQRPARRGAGRLPPRRRTRAGPSVPAPKPATAAPAPAAAEPAPAKAAAPAKPAAASPAEAPGDETQVLRGAAAAVVKNMSASLDVPTATSVRAIPAKLMIDNRDRHQQPPQAHPRRQDLVHPPARATRSCRRSRSSRT